MFKEKRVIIIIFFIIYLITINSKIDYKEKTLINTDLKYNINNNINAKSFIVMDQNTLEVLAGNNIHVKLLPASITKILTCYTALQLYDLDDYVLITKEVNTIIGSKIYLKENDIISIRDLIYGSLLVSGNDAAYFLAKHYSGNVNDFIYKMNEIAYNLGATNSIFNNPSGLDKETRNYSTAYDMALIMAKALTNDDFKRINITKNYVVKLYSGNTLYFHNKHRLINNLPNVIGGKTGYTKLAGRTLVTSFKQDDRVIIIVTFGCSDDWQVHQLLAKTYL